MNGENALADASQSLLQADEHAVAVVAQVDQGAAEAGKMREEQAPLVQSADARFGGFARSVPSAGDVVVAVELEPELKPDRLAGMLCPLQTVYIHSGFSRETLHKVWPAAVMIVAMLGLSVASNVAQAVVLAESQDVPPDELRERVNRAVAPYTSASCMLFVVAVLYFFLFYKPRMGARTGTTPDALSRCFCPLPLVYYHEGNKCNEKSFFACLLGPIYTCLCYDARYGAEEPAVHTVVLTV